MVVIILDNVSSSSRGELTRWMLEPKPGVFLGSISAMVREKLWSKLIEEQSHCGGVMFYSTNTEQGYGIEMFGETKREIIDFEGLKLVKIPQK